MATATATATATFIAVQCFNCSTMQVKQQKKSSNKWTCVVCNEKQSVRKVYAHNSMAKHVRTFVQSFNMRRKFEDDDAEKCLRHETLTDEIPHPPLNLNGTCMRKSMTDWSAYLDSDEQDNADTPAAAAEEEDTVGHKVVTELPLEMFKRPRLRRSGLKTNGGLYKPSFSKGTKSAANESSQEMKSKNDDARAGSKEGSRWTAYLTHEEKEDGEQETGGCFNAHLRNCGADIANASDAFTMMDQQFEEDIHPDFK